MLTLLKIAAILAVPAAAEFAAARSKLLKSLGAVVICYLAGIALGAAGLDLPAPASKALTSLTVALAVPLLLLSTDFLKWVKAARPAIISFSLAAAAAVLSAALYAKAFESRVPEARAVAAMLAGVYTGGTPNMSAIGVALKVPDETFILVNGADMLFSTMYLLFLVSAGRGLLARVFPPYPKQKSAGAAEERGHSAFAKLPPWRKAKAAAAALGLSALLAAFSSALSVAVFGRVSETFFILSVTTLGIGGSFLPPLRALKGSFETGHYLLLAFCVVVGVMTDLGSVLRGGLGVSLLVFAVISTAILVHYAAAALLGIDRDTVMVTSAAGIMSPPFVVVVAEALDNREVLVAGITSGLLGYAIGNYLGLAVYHLF